MEGASFPLAVHPSTGDSRRPLERGGGNVVNQVASHLRQELVGNVANLAAQGDKAARTAITIVKQAKRLGQNYQDQGMSMVQ